MQTQTNQRNEKQASQLNQWKTMETDKEIKKACNLEDTKTKTQTNQT